MKKIMLKGLAVFLLAYASNVLADSDMFQTIEEFENCKIGRPYIRGALYPGPRFHIPLCTPPCDSRTPCKQIADDIRHPYHHGRPVVSEDDF